MRSDGFRRYPGHLDGDAQRTLLREIEARVRCAPFYRPIAPWGRPMSVEMTNLGERGWTASPSGYAYRRHHPLTHAPWPAIPRLLLELWSDLASATVPPDACLVNVYRAGAKMGLHQDRDEADLSVPVVSVSLGDTAWFRLGGPTRRSPCERMRLESGDVCVMAGPSRLAFHGVDRIETGQSDLIPGGGRINLTVRRAGPVDPIQPFSIERALPCR